LLALASASSAGGWMGCHPTPAEQPTPHECLEQIRVRAIFGGVARAAAELGRYDPYLYPEGDEPVASGSDATASASQSLRRAIDLLRADPLARAAFQSRLAAAKLVCPADSCPTGPYPTKVTPSRQFGELREAYEFSFTGDPPPDTVLRSFATVFSYDHPEAKGCSTPPAVDVKARLIYASSDNCDSDHPPPTAGDRCRPPRGGHWKKEGSDLCCRT
jgi:hypothetical protein